MADPSQEFISFLANFVCDFHQEHKKKTDDWLLEYVSWILKNPNASDQERSVQIPPLDRVKTAKAAFEGGQCDLASLRSYLKTSNTPFDRVFNKPTREMPLQEVANG